MQDTTSDPRCPECDEPIGQRATYCMHCSADLSDYRERAESDRTTGQYAPGNSRSSGTAGRLLGSETRTLREMIGNRGDSADPDREDLLAPDGLVDDTLTVVVGIAAGALIGLIGATVLAVMTGSPWALVGGLLIWLGSTAYLARRRTVQGAIAAGGYGVAIVLLVVPFLAFSPMTDVEGGLSERGSIFLVLGVFVVIPVLIAAAVGWTAARFAPNGKDDTSASADQ